MDSMGAYELPCDTAGTVPVELFDPFDPFNPNLIPIEKPDDVCYISLSSRWDLQVMLDRQDYEWAKAISWHHTYGSGGYIEVYPDIMCIARPDHIYANYRSREGCRWLHREICERAYGKPRYRDAITDHKNGNTLDCRRVNLRWASRAMNVRNRPGTKIRARLLKESRA